MAIKLYFPNFIFTLIRSGRFRDPNQAVFRVPNILTKPDIKQYLTKLYGLTVTHIHTVNFMARDSKARRRHYPAYKNAIVTYKGPIFQFPAAPESKLLKYPGPDAGLPRYPKVS